MNKIILVTILAGSVMGNAMGQGVVLFFSTQFAGRAINYNTDGGATSSKTGFPTGNPSSLGTFGNLNVAMYAASAGTILTLVDGAPDLSEWKISAPLWGIIGSISGSMPSVPYTLDASLGAPQSGPVEVEVVGWTGAYTDFTSALAAYQAGTAAIGWCGSAISGGALGFQMTNTGTESQPVVIANGPDAYNGLTLLTPIPEPGTIALGGLGAAAFLAFRRRK